MPGFSFKRMTGTKGQRGQAAFHWCPAARSYLTGSEIKGPSVSSAVKPLHLSVKHSVKSMQMKTIPQSLLADGTCLHSCCSSWTVPCWTFFENVHLQFSAALPVMFVLCAEVQSHPKCFKKELQELHTPFKASSSGTVKKLPDSSLISLTYHYSCLHSSSNQIRTTNHCWGILLFTHFSLEQYWKLHQWVKNIKIVCVKSFLGGRGDVQCTLQCWYWVTYLIVRLGRSMHCVLTEYAVGSVLVYDFKRSSHSQGCGPGPTVAV